MGPEAANLAGSLAKSLDVDRSSNASQRAGEIAREQTAARFNSDVSPIKAEQADALRRARLLQERERRRRQIERQLTRSNDDDDQQSDDQGLDVMV